MLMFLFALPIILILALLGVTALAGLFAVVFICRGRLILFGLLAVVLLMGSRYYTRAHEEGARQEATLAEAAEADRKADHAQRKASRAEESPAEPEADSPSQGSVAPSGKAEPKSRPAWVDAPATVQPDGTFATQVSVGPYATVEECQRQLDGALQEAVNDYIESGLWQSEPQGGRIEVPLAFIRDHIASGGEFLEQREHSFGPMYTLHARLAFDREVQDQLRDMKRQAVVDGRLRQAGLGSLLVLGVLGTLFGYLKVDTATRGYYTGRLQLGTALLTLGLLFVGVYFVRQV